MHAISPVVPTLSDSELLNTFARIRAKEHELLLKLLVYLNEIDSRKLYLKEGYSSLFAYLTDGCGYSEGSAHRRIQAARLIGEYREVYEYLKERRLTLATIAMVAPVLKERKGKTLEILNEISGKKVFEVEKIVARFREVKVIPKEKVTVFVPKDESSQLRTLTLFDNPAPKETTSTLAVETPPVSTAPCYFKLQFAVSEATHAKLERVKVLLSGKYPKGACMAEMMDELLDMYIEENDRKVKEERVVTKTKVKPASKTRYIPKKVKDFVYKRDNGQCSFVSVDGRRCGCEWDLEIDHRDLFCRTKDNDPSNLRLLCRSHNAFMAEKMLGKEFMAQFAAS
jgi:hypothetical protein